jgi:serine/threonine protein kinase
MRSSSPLMSYRQVLETRQRGLTEAEVSALLHQLLVELAKSHAIGQTHGDLSLESLWRDISGDLYMNPPLGIATQSSPRGDVMAIANIAIELLTNQPPSNHWQTHCSIHPALAEILEQARSDFSANAPQNASQLLQVLYGHLHPQTPSPSPEPKTKFNPFAIPLIVGTGKWIRRIFQSVLLLGVLIVAGWSAYEHFSTLIFEKNSNPADRPSPASPEPSPSQPPRPNGAIVIPPKPDNSDR